MFVSRFNAIRFGQLTAVTHDGAVTADDKGSGNTAKVENMLYKATVQRVIAPDAVQLKLDREFQDKYGGKHVKTRDGVETIGQ